MMKTTLAILFVLLLLPVASSLYVPAPILVEQKTTSDIVSILEPQNSRSFHGELQGFPHTYQIEAGESFRLKVEISVPDIPEAKNNVSGIIIREIEGSGRVEEVARLSAGEASWEKFYDPFIGNTYRKGPFFDEEVHAGVYRVEVNTPDNLEKYVLRTGHLRGSDLSYFETLRQIAEIKSFFNQSGFLAVASPLVYVPLSILVLFIGVLTYWRIKHCRKDVL